MNKIKNAWKSLTIWFNTAGVVLLASAMAEPTLASYLTSNSLTWVLVVGNLILRYKTDTGLDKK